mgnify:FL=1
MNTILPTLEPAVADTKPDEKPSNKTLTEKYGIWVVIASTLVWPLLTAILQNRGIITPEQKSTLDKGAQTVLLVGKDDAGDVTVHEVEVEKTPAVTAAPPSSVVAAKPKVIVKPKAEPSPVSSEAISKAIDEKLAAIDWQKILIDKLGPILLDWLDKIKPKPPDPTPPNPVPPNPQPPVPPSPPVPPTPLPPQPGTLKIVVHDKAKAPITSQTVESGRWFRVSATGAKGAIAWQTDQGGVPEYGASGDGSEFTGFLHDGDWISFTAIDYEGRSNVTLRIGSNHGPQPPPNPVDPINPVVPDQPKPVDPPAPSVTSFRVLFVRESGVKEHTAVPGAQAVRA